MGKITSRKRIGKMTVWCLGYIYSGNGIDEYTLEGIYTTNESALEALTDLYEIYKFTPSDYIAFVIEQKEVI